MWADYLQTIKNTILASRTGLITPAPIIASVSRNAGGGFLFLRLHHKDSDQQKALWTGMAGCFLCRINPRLRAPISNTLKEKDKGAPRQD